MNEIGPNITGNILFNYLNKTVFTIQYEKKTVKIKVAIARRLLKDRTMWKTGKTFAFFQLAEYVFRIFNYALRVL